jgi:GNAT superfamily N-acetyltransferase
MMEAMDLKVSAKRALAGGRSGRAPFELNAEFRAEWWNAPFRYISGEDHHYVEARLDGVEVARAELFEPMDFSHYGVPPMGHDYLKIQFVEVAQSYRCRGIGQAFVRRLIGTFPGRCLVAFSEGADAFWLALGWTRFDHPDEPEFYQPLFVQRV